MRRAQFHPRPRKKIKKKKHTKHITNSVDEKIRGHLEKIAMFEKMLTELQDLKGEE